MSAVIFDEATHRYSVDGVFFPSVTQVLPETRFFCTPEQLEAARQEGEDNHTMVKMFFDTGDTFGDPLLEAFSLWLNANRPALGDVVAYEKPMVSIKHRFAGTPDMIFEHAVVDLKRSPGNWKRHALQLAGYSIMAVENGLIKKPRVNIVLWYDGKKFKERNVFDPVAEGLFISLVKKHFIDQEVSKWMNAN